MCFKVMIICEPGGCVMALCIFMKLNMDIKTASHCKVSVATFIDVCNMFMFDSKPI